MSDGSVKPIVQGAAADRPTYNLADGATPADVGAWIRARFAGADPHFGFGRGGEDRDAPHLLVGTFYRNGTPALRAAIRDEVVRALRRRAKGEDLAPGPVLEHVLRLVEICALGEASDAVRDLASGRVLGDREDADGLRDAALRTLSALRPTWDEAFWREQAAARPRPAVLQAAVRARAWSDVPAALDFLAQAVRDGGALRAAAAVGALLPTLRRWWEEADPSGRDPRSFLRLLEAKLPRQVLDGFGPFLEALHRQAGFRRPAGERRRPRQAAQMEARAVQHLVACSAFPAVARQRAA